MFQVQRDELSENGVEVFLSSHLERGFSHFVWVTDLERYVCTSFYSAWLKGQRLSARRSVQ